MLKNLISKKFIRGAKNAGYLTIGNILTKIITIIGFLYIPNRLGSHNYGLYTTAFAFTGLFSILGFGGLNMVILREASKEKEAINRYINKVINLRIILSIIQILTVFIVANTIKKYSGLLLILIYIVSFELVYKNIRSIFKALIQADEKMKFLSVYNIVYTFTRIVGTVVILYFNNDIISILVYRLLVDILSLYFLYQKVSSIIDFNLNLNLRNIKIPFFIFKQSLVFSLLGFAGALAMKIDVTMLSLLSTPEEVGVYGLAEKIVKQFEMLRGVTITAFFPIFVKRFNKGAVRLKKIIKVFFILFVISLGLASLLSFILDDIVKLLFSDEYLLSAKILKVLSFYLVVYFSNIPLTLCIRSAHKEKYLLYMYPFSIIINILLNYILYYRMGIIGFAYSTLAVRSFQLVFIFSFVMLIMRRQENIFK